MNKSDFFETLIQTLEAELALAIDASKDAASYATNEEARAESKWDTQGLEASYLAAGQADQARQWAEAIKELRAEKHELLLRKNSVSLGALFVCDFGGEQDRYFYAGVAGGHEVQMDGQMITVITPQSPLAARLLGLKEGESFRLPNGNYGQVITIE